MFSPFPSLTLLSFHIVSLVDLINFIVSIIMGDSPNLQFRLLSWIPESYIYLNVSQIPHWHRQWYMPKTNLILLSPKAFFSSLSMNFQIKKHRLCSLIHLLNPKQSLSNQLLLIVILLSLYPSNAFFPYPYHFVLGLPYLLNVSPWLQFYLLLIYSLYYTKGTVKKMWILLM